MFVHKFCACAENCQMMFKIYDCYDCISLNKYFSVFLVFWILLLEEAARPIKLNIINIEFLSAETQNLRTNTFYLHLRIIITLCDTKSVIDLLFSIFSPYGNKRNLMSLNNRKRDMNKTKCTFFLTKDQCAAAK